MRCICDEVANLLQKNCKNVFINPASFIVGSISNASLGSTRQFGILRCRVTQSPDYAGDFVNAELIRPGPVNKP